MRINRKARKITAKIVRITVGNTLKGFSDLIDHNLIILSRVVRGRVSPSMLYKDTENPITKILPTYPSHIKFRGKRDSNDDLGTFSSFYKRSNTPLTDLGSFSSFYKRRLFKRNTGQTPDDLDTFSSMFKRGGNDLAAAATR